MTFLARFRIATDTDKKKAVQQLVVGSTPDFTFFFLIILSVLVATFGLLLDSAAVVIGSMLIAPILYPFLSLSLAMVMSDYRLLYRSFYTLAKSLALGVGLSFVATLMVRSTDAHLTGEILQRAEPSLIYFTIAFLSGLAVTYTLVHEDMNETFPGIAVSVALLPPLAVIGIGLATFNWDLVVGSLSLFLVNAAGVVFASMISFSLMDLYDTKKVADSTLEKEQKRVEKEQKEVEKIENEVQNDDGKA